jgi:hypothetical protein
MAAILTAGLVALTGALVLAGSLLSWLLLRNTGVDWMFQN